MGIGLQEYNTIESRRGRFYTPIGHSSASGKSSSSSVIGFPLFGSDPLSVPATTLSTDDMALSTATTQWNTADGYASNGDDKKADDLKNRIVKTYSEHVINSVGYQFLNNGYASVAADVFQRNVAAHPKSWNAYDSLGDAYSQVGLRVMAIDSYNSALKLATSPKDINSIQVKLKQVQRTK